MGTITTRSGKLHLDFRYRGIRCREQTRLPDTAENRRRLTKLLDRIDAEILLGTFDYSKYFPGSKRVAKFVADERRRASMAAQAPLFEECAQSWFHENEARWRPSYRDTVRHTINDYLLPQFGHLCVSQITRADILGFRADLMKRRSRFGRRLSAERVNHIVSPLRMILAEASLRYDFVSPAQGIKGIPVPRTDIEPFSFEEVSRILENVRPDFRNYYTVRFLTGMRTGEIDGLTWRYVDFERDQILIRKSLVGGRLGPAKTDGSHREIQMSQPVRNALTRQASITGGLEHVFTNTLGKPLAHRNVTQRVWYPLLNQLGIRKRRPYSTRHTAATLWLAAGENAEWVAKQLGHTTTEMLFRRYSRFVPDITRKDGSAFEKLLQTTLSTPSGAQNESDN